MALKTCHLLQAAIVATAVATLSTACSSSGGSAGKTTAAGTQSGTPAAAGSSVTISLAGGRLTAPDGHTLYYNTVDTASKIDCVGVCATNWPPLVGTPKAASGIDQSDLSTATRPGGGVQVTYYGHPLYEFKADTTGQVARRYAGPGGRHDQWVQRVRRVQLRRQGRFQRHRVERQQRRRRLRLPVIEAPETPTIRAKGSGRLRRVPSAGTACAADTAR
jgi:predicted lipoprotein with Yx(FWY)xxD motif